MASSGSMTRIEQQHPRFSKVYDCCLYCVSIPVLGLVVLSKGENSQLLWNGIQDWGKGRLYVLKAISNASLRYCRLHMKRNCPIPHLQSAQPLRWAVHEADQIIQLGVCCIALIGSGHRGYMATTAVCIIKRSKAEQLDSWMHAKAAGYHQSGPSLTPAKGNHRSTPVFLYTFIEDIAVTRQLEVLVIQVGLCRDGARTQTKSLTERSVFVWIPLLKRKWDREVSKGLVEVKTRARIGYRCPAIRFRAHNSLLLQVLVAADPKSASVRKRRLHTRYKCVWRSWSQLEFGSRCGLSFP